MSKNEEVGFASALRTPVELGALVAEVMHKALDAVDENWHLACIDPDGDGSCAKGHRARRMLAEDVAPAVLDALAAAGVLLPEAAENEGFSWGVRNEEGWVYQCADRLDAESLIAARMKLSPHNPPGDLVRRRWAATWEPATAVGTAGGGQPNASDLGSVETQKGNTE